MGRKAWNKGIPRSKETKRKISESLKGHVISKETKRKLSIAQKRIGNEALQNWNREHGNWNKGLTKDTDPRLRKISIVLTGQRRSEAVKRKISKTTKEAMKKVPREKLQSWKDKRLSKEHKMKISESLKGHSTSEETKQKIREARLRQVFPRRDSSIEILMQKGLKERGIHFTTQVSLLKKYQVDILIGDNLVVECDGDYWHNFPEGLEKDRIRDQELADAGYNVLRFWEREINSNIQSCVNQIAIGGGG